MMPILVNACVFCGEPSQGNYTIHRDGALNGSEGNPEVPLCDGCGEAAWPSLRDIWARISLRDDRGQPWGATIDPCERPA